MKRKTSIELIARAAALAITASFAVAILAPGPSMAQTYQMMNCSELWYERNEIYANKGYCFKTARAKQAFGKRCYKPFGRLSRLEKNVVSDIKAEERRKGC